MQIDVTVRHFTAPPELKDLVENEIRKLERYYDGVLACHVILSRENGHDIAEIIAHSKKHQFTVIEENPKIEHAVASAITKLKSQIMRYKDKLVSK
jgi:ribosomal subunit interface protein